MTFFLKINLCVYTHNAGQQFWTQFLLWLYIYFVKNNSDILISKLHSDFFYHVKFTFYSLLSEQLQLFCWSARNTVELVNCFYHFIDNTKRTYSKNLFNCFPFNHFQRTPHIIFWWRVQKSSQRFSILWSIWRIL